MYFTFRILLTTNPNSFLRKISFFFLEKKKMVSSLFKKVNSKIIFKDCVKIPPE